MPFNEESREYRSLETTLSFENKDDNEQYVVRGYATTFNQPYKLFDQDGITYYEKVDRNAFNGADLSDVILQYDHNGKVLARNRNDTLKLEVDDHGLLVHADLSSTTSSRQMYEEIATGLVDKMSFGFTVAEDDYDTKTHTRTIKRFKKIFDVSAVSTPANNGTEISVLTRRCFDGFIEAEKAECLKREQIQKEQETLRQKIRILAEH